MKIIEIDINNVIKVGNNLQLCLGYFDGLHLGHLKLIKDALKHGPTGVMTFDISPHLYLKKVPLYSTLTSLADKADILEDLGVKYLFVLRTNDELIHLDKKAFIEKILLKLDPNKIYVGQDYRFGYMGKGTPNYLSKFIPTKIEKLYIKEKKKISSTYIINLIKEGNVKEAHKLLSRPYSLSGLVVEGNKKGRDLGFPTANLDLDFPYVLPKIGVYMGYCYFMSRKRKAIVSVSTHPTFQELDKPIVEVHIIGFDENIYGRFLKVEFINYIRDVIKFNSLDDLKIQLEKDKDLAIKRLK